MSSRFTDSSVLSAVTIMLATITGCVSQDRDDASLLAEARAITQQFTATLLPTLQNALSEGGPEHAIEVCSVRAPEIANELAESTHWSVRRVSLKARNDKIATPDSWERKVLSEFEARQSKGETGATLSESGKIDGEFRFMQAQITMPLCLTCHGTNVSAGVSAALREKYPNDLATGYRAGEVRGAISLRYSRD